MTAVFKLNIKGRDEAELLAAAGPHNANAVAEILSVSAKLSDVTGRECFPWFDKRDNAWKFLTVERRPEGVSVKTYAFAGLAEMHPLLLSHEVAGAISAAALAAALQPYRV